MQQASSQSRQSVQQLHHLVMRLSFHAHATVEVVALLVLLAFAVWLLFPRSWEGVAGRSLIQSALYAGITFVSAVVLVRATAPGAPLTGALGRLSRLVSPRRALIAFVVSMAVGEVVTLTSWSWPKLIFPVLFVATTTLPAAVIISYIARRLHVRLDAGRALGLLSYGILIAVAMAQLAESGGNEVLRAAFAFLVQTFAGSQERIAYELLLQGESLGVPAWPIALAVSLSMLVQSTIAAPLIEEAAKASALLFPRLRVDRNGAFVGGMFAGLGFALAESLMRETLPSGSATLLLLRGGAGIVHILATGLVALALYDLLHGNRRSAVLHALQGLGVHAAWNLAASVPGMLSLLFLVLTPSDDGGASVAANLPGFEYIWLVGMILLMLFLSVSAVQVALRVRREGLPVTIQQPLSLRLDSLKVAHPRGGRAMLFVLVLVAALVSAGLVNFSASAETYRNSLITERYTNAKESLARGDYEQALRHLEAVRQVSPENPQLDQAIEVTRSRYILLNEGYEEGKRLYEDGQWQEAAWYFDRIFELEPQFKNVRQLRQKAASEAERQPE